MGKNMFAKRREAVAAHLENQSLLFLCAGQAKQKSLDQDYPFEIDRNFYYLTGLEQQHTLLLLTKINDEVKEHLFIDRPDPYWQRYHGKMPDLADLQEQTGIENIYYLDKFDWEMGRLLFRNPFENLYFDFHQPVLTGVSSEKQLSDRIMGAHPYLHLRNISSFICNQRRVKDPEELAYIRQAVAATKEGIRLILDHLHPGLAEDQMQAWFEFGIKNAHGKGNAFNPIIASGKNSVFLHYDQNNQVMADGDVLLVDLGAECGHYAADISRTFPVNGKFTEEQRFFYNVVLHGQEQVFAFLKPGAYLPQAVDVARQAMGEKLLESGLIQDLAEMKTLLPDGVSHNIGLDVHDVGDDPLLVPGMVVTVEPGIYLPEKGLGIRIEDDVVITETGCEPLSLDIPRTVEQIEAYLAAVQNKVG